AGSLQATRSMEAASTAAPRKDLVLIVLSQFYGACREFQQEITMARLRSAPASKSLAVQSVDVVSDPLSHLGGAGEDPTLILGDHLGTGAVSTDRKGVPPGCLTVDTYVKGLT